MRIDDYFEFGEILDGVETKILFQSKVQDLKVMDNHFSGNCLLNTLLAGATLNQSYTDGLNFALLFVTKEGRYIHVDWQDGCTLTVTEIFLPNDDDLTV